MNSVCDVSIIAPRAGRNNQRGFRRLMTARRSCSAEPADIRGTHKLELHVRQNQILGGAVLGPDAIEDDMNEGKTGTAFTNTHRSHRLQVKRDVPIFHIRLDGAGQPAVRRKRGGGDCSQHAARSAVRFGIVAGGASGQARSGIIAPAERPTTKTTEQRLLTPFPVQAAAIEHPLHRGCSSRGTCSVAASVSAVNSR